MPNNLISYDIQCPFYMSEKRLSISCEDAPHFYAKIGKKKWWMKHYCMNEWQECEYAAGLLKAYDDEERGDDMALENRKSESLRQELRNMSKRLGKSREIMERKDRKIEELMKENENLKTVNENNRLYRQRLYKKMRETKKALEEENVRMFEQLMELQDIINTRLAYLIDTKCEDGLLDKDVDEWAAKQEAEVKICGTWDKEKDSRKWVTIRMPEVVDVVAPKETEDEQLLGEKTEE